MAQAVYDGTTPVIVAEAALRAEGLGDVGSMQAIAEAGAASRGARSPVEGLLTAEGFADAIRPILTKEYQQAVDRFAGGTEAETPSVSSLRKSLALAEGMLDDAQKVIRAGEQHRRVVDADREALRVELKSVHEEIAAGPEPIITTECSIVGFGRKTRTGGLSAFAVSLAGGNQTSAVGLNITADEYEALVGAEHLNVPYRLTITKADR